MSRRHTELANSMATSRTNVHKNTYFLSYSVIDVIFSHLMISRYMLNLKPNITGVILKIAILSTLSSPLAAETNNATVSIDATLARKIGDRAEINRRQYFNIHGEPRNFEEDPSMENYLFNTLDVYGGRSFNYGWFMNQTPEDPNRPGFWDASRLSGRENAARRRWVANGSPTIDPNSDQIIVGHIRESYPTPQDITNARNSGGFRTRNHDALADYATRWIKGIFPKPTYFEPTNEIDVHISDANTSWENVSQLYTKTARAFRAAGLSTKVAGTADAWPQFERNNFGVWNSRAKRFIDLAGDEIGALSYHVYDREGGNLEAILDLVENYTNNQYGSPIPYLLTEGGASGRSLGPNPEQERYRILRVNNATLMQLMERDGRMEKWIPFNTATAIRRDGSTEWSSGLREWSQSQNKWVWSDIIHLYELWKDVKGKRCYVNSTDPDVIALGFIDGSTLHLCLHNITDGRANVNLRRITGNASVNSATISRLSYRGNRVNYQEDLAFGQNTSTLTLVDGETAIIKYNLNRAPTLQATIEERTHYGNKVIQPVRANQAINIAINGVPNGSKSYAKLRFGLGNVTTASLNPQIKINGTTLNYSTDIFGNESRDFTSREAIVPVNLLRNNNTVQFIFPQNGGHLSTAVLVVGKGPRIDNGGENNTDFRAGITISLKGNNGLFVSSENGSSPMNCNRSSSAAWEKFEVGSGPNGTFTFKNQGKFISSENGRRAITCNRNSPNSWERFTVTINGDSLTLKGSNGAYISSENGTSNMSCNRSSAGAWERFTWNIIE